MATALVKFDENEEFEDLVLMCETSDHAHIIGLVPVFKKGTTVLLGYKSKDADWSKYLLLPDMDESFVTEWYKKVIVEELLQKQIEEEQAESDRKQAEWEADEPRRQAELKALLDGIEKEIKEGTYYSSRRESGLESVTKHVANLLQKYSLKPDDLLITLGLKKGQNLHDLSDEDVWEADRRVTALSEGMDALASEFGVEKATSEFYRLKEERDGVKPPEPVPTDPTKRPKLGLPKK